MTNTKVDELMHGRSKRDSMLMGVAAGRWIQWSVGIVAAVALGYFGVVKTVDRNSTQVRQLGEELVETRSAIRELDQRLDQSNIEFVQLRALVQQQETLKSIGKTLRDIYDELKASNRRRRR